VRRSLQAEYGRISGVVPTGADTNFFTPPRSRPVHARPRVLFVGALRSYKCPQSVLQAATRFPDADFVMVGAGDMEAELQQQIARESLSNVRLAGALSQEQVRDQYRSADVFFFPSACEGSPKVIVEAAACGLPVIVRNNYRPDTVIDGQTGYITDSVEEMM